MSDWVKYTGSDEQIAEIKNTKDGYVLRKIDGKEVFFLSLEFRPNLSNVTHYLICKRHPLANMIIRQAETGQEVYIRWVNITCGHCVTTTPDWNIPNAEYSFSSFEKEIEFNEEV